MEKSKIKSLIIYILAFLNFFLGAILIADWIAERRTADLAKKEIGEIFRERGVLISAEIPEDAGRKIRLSVIREEEEESRIASALFGDVKFSDWGGNNHNYSGESGWISFRGTGYFEIAFEDASFDSPEEFETAVQDILKQMKIDISPEVHRESGAGGKYSAKYACSIPDLDIFNCNISCSYDGANLMYISGTRPFPVARRETLEEYLDALTILTDFLYMVNTQGYVLNEITDIREGYIMSSTVSGDGVLDPVWRITTDTAVYYFDSVSGEPL